MYLHYTNFYNIMQEILKGTKCMKEMEYKFLVSSIPFTYSTNMYSITQYYLDKKIVMTQICSLLLIDNETAKSIHNVRVRKCIENDIENYYLTAKTKGDFVRDEYERRITKEEALTLIQNANKMIKKIRYTIIEKKIKFEFDYYYLRKDKLKICEVEVSDKTDYNKILNILKNTFNIEFTDVTYQEQYKNYNLAQGVDYERNI